MKFVTLVSLFFLLPSMSQAQALNVPAMFSVGKGGISAVNPENLLDVTSQLGCFPMQSQMNSLAPVLGTLAYTSYAQIEKLSGKLAAGQTVDITYHVCNGTGLGPLFGPQVIYGGSLTAVLIAPDGTVENYIVSKNNTGYRGQFIAALPVSSFTTLSNSISGGSGPGMKRRGPGTWILRLSAGSKGAAISLLDLDVNSYYMCPATGC